MRWVNLGERPAMVAILFGAAVAMAGCGDRTRAVAPKAAIRDTVREVVGTDLIGARGATVRDQDKIDATAAGLCNAQVWTGPECRRHGERAR